LVLTCTCTE